MIISDHGPDPQGGPNCRECGNLFPCEPYRCQARDFAEAEEARVAAQWGPEAPRPSAGGANR